MQIAKDAKILVTGSTGMLGSALVRKLQEAGYTNLLLPTHKELDLLKEESVFSYFERHRPEYVYHLAGKVGGIKGNSTYPADFTRENLRINMNVIEACHSVGVDKLINFGSICIYPVEASTPVKEDSLLTGPLEVTNEGYAIAKIASLMLCKKFKEQYGDNFISVMPDNIFGKNDNFHSQNAHVAPMLMRRIHEAKLNGTPEVIIWGSGNQTRGFIYADDVADGLIFIMENYDEAQHINLGTGVETSIRELAETLKEVIGYEGKLVFDTTKPDGTPKRYLDTSKLDNLGWKAKYSLEEGLKEMYEWFLENQGNLREH